MERTTYMPLTYPLMIPSPLQKVLGKLILMMMFKMLVATPYLAQQHYRACPSLFSTFFHVMMMMMMMMINYDYDAGCPKPFH